MTAAAPVTSPWPGTAGNWKPRRDEEVVIQVWRLIANAGPRGISKADLCDRMNGMDSYVMAQHLQELRRKGHARFEGVNGSTKIGVWVATPMAWPNEPPPAWIMQAAETADGHAADAEESATDELAPKPGAADKLVKAARDVPNSVFALGAAAAGSFGVDIDAVHMPAQREQAQAGTQPQAAAETTTGTTTDTTADTTAEVSPTPAAPPEPQRPDAEPIVVALDNRGRLLVHEAPEQPVLLSPKATRALFSYLDRTVCGVGVLTEALP